MKWQFRCFVCFFEFASDTLKRLVSGLKISFLLSAGKHTKRDKRGKIHSSHHKNTLKTHAHILTKYGRFYAIHLLREIYRRYHEFFATKKRRAETHREHASASQGTLKIGD